MHCFKSKDVSPYLLRYRNSFTFELRTIFIIGGTRQVEVPFFLRNLTGLHCDSNSVEEGKEQFMDLE